MANSKTFAVRLPIALAEIVDARAEADGISAAEVIRTTLHAWAYGQPAGADEGYYVARAQAARIAHHLILDAQSRLPSSDEEARELLAEIPPNHFRRLNPNG